MKPGAAFLPREIHCRDHITGPVHFTILTGCSVKETFIEQGVARIRTPQEIPVPAEYSGELIPGI